ncbi:hypothetical protein HMPREF0653_00713 [Prevotella disiens JCM 6334 = ATCC 29426]|uniref:Uncharacterized protein n=1 Tax=Prevotella disiens JCM 6334 = ATCC 29426 TaxID=1235811 RepID=A0ABN0NTU4_9BACT|nr:hypothetical protein HMPREF0653_00713 [Prevotella disiens JCM 6334 = ATCC 29426]
MAQKRGGLILSRPPIFTFIDMLFQINSNSFLLNYFTNFKS